MQKIDALLIPAHGQAVLKRGGNHIMLIGIINSVCQKALADDKIMITLTFCDGTSQDISFKITWPA